MKEIVVTKLENEMDIILAHKRAMKLAELAGCSLISQTSLATAVSEISRIAREGGNEASVHLFIEAINSKKYIRAEVKSQVKFSDKLHSAAQFAKRLVNDLQLVKTGNATTIVIKFHLNFGGTLTEFKILNIKDYFDKEPPLSFYDELRRKNQQLQDMADKIKESQDEYRILSDTLPLMMFSVNDRALITYANKWLIDFFGSVPKELKDVFWKNYIHDEDFPHFAKDLALLINKQIPVQGQYRMKQKYTGNFIWHLLSVIPLKNDKEKVTGWIGFLVDTNAQKIIEQTLKDNMELKETQQQLFVYQNELEKKVIELNRSNYELEQFAHLASHDLQEPLRKLFFYSDMLKKKYSAALDAGGAGIINSMTHAAGRMRELISDLLSYSQLHQQNLVMEEIHLNSLLGEIIEDFDIALKDKDASVHVEALPVITGNVLRMRQLFTNLISNALKYSRSEIKPVIQITSEYQDNGFVKIKIRDNGIGFDNDFSEKIFGLFERLHTRSEYPGTGIGLSICKKIMLLHQGTISAHAKENEFAEFILEFPLITLIKK